MSKNIIKLLEKGEGIGFEAKEETEVSYSHKYKLLRLLVKADLLEKYATLRDFKNRYHTTNKGRIVLRSLKILEGQP